MDASIMSFTSVVKPNPKKQRSWIAYLYIIIGAICSAVSNLCLKLSKPEEKANFVLVRCILQFIILYPYISCKKLDVVRAESQSNLLLLARGLCGSLGMLSLALSLKYLSLGDAISIFYTFPVLVGIFAFLFLKEKCGILNVVLTVIALVGTIFITQPPFIFGGDKGEDFQSRISGVLWGVASSTFTGVTCTVIRKLGSQVHFSISVFYFSWVGAVFTAIYMAIADQEFLVCLTSLPILFGGSLLLLLTQCFMTLAYQYENAGLIAVVQTAEVPFAFLLEFLVLGTVPTLYSFIGAGLIISCFIILALKSIKKAMK